MMSYPLPIDERDIISLLEDVLKNEAPITDGFKRAIWVWIQVCPSRNPIVLYREIVRHPDKRMMKLELGWPANNHQDDTADDESPSEKQTLKPVCTDFLSPERMFH